MDCLPSGSGPLELYPGVGLAEHDIMAVKDKLRGPSILDPALEDLDMGEREGGSGGCSRGSNVVLPVGPEPRAARPRDEADGMHDGGGGEREEGQIVVGGQAPGSR